MKYLLCAAMLLMTNSIMAQTDEQEYNYKVKDGDREYTFRTREDK